MANVIADTRDASPAFSTTPTVHLTAEQVAFFHREGYLSLPMVTTEAEVQWMRVIYDRLFEQRAGRERGDHFDLGGTDEEGKAPVLPQILNVSKYAPELERTLARTNATHIAWQLLGEESRFIYDHAINKPARTGAATPWHQDEAYHRVDRDCTSVNLWIPLQPATLENGCMQFVPRSHEMDGVLPHRPIGNDPRVSGLECNVPAEMLARAVPCPLAAGGATLHQRRSLHYAGPNVSASPRRAYILHFETPPVMRAVPKSFPWQKVRQVARDQRASQAEAREKAARGGQET